MELVPNAPCVGVNASPVSCAAVTASPAVTGVTPSAKVTAPSVGRAVIVLVSCAAARPASDGAAMPIGVAGAFSATVSVGELTTGFVLCRCATVPVMVNVCAASAPE